MEAALLAALEKRDAESYNLLKAIQDVALASATVDLRDLRVKESKDGLSLAALQRDRAQIQVDHFDELIDEGTIKKEQASMILGLIGSVASGASRVVAQAQQIAVPVGRRNRPGHRTRIVLRPVGQ